jgi:hypothetical protein
MSSQPLLVADLAQRRMVFGVREIDAALALDRLEQHGDDIGVARGELLDGGEVVEGHAHEAADQRLETGLHLAVAGGGQRCQRAAVEGVLHDDDGRAVDALLMAVHARQLDGGFVGLAAGVAEEHLVHARQRGQAILQYKNIRRPKSNAAAVLANVVSVKANASFKGVKRSDRN